MGDVIRLAELIRTRNVVTKEIADLIQRPALIGHVGEFIASHIFGIALEESASQKGIDGLFTIGQLAGKSVNIRWYAKRENLLDIRPDALPEYYLVLAGPESSVPSSRGGVRPWLIESVYLFDARELVDRVRARGVKIGVATRVRQELWDEAEVYPTPTNTRLVLSEEQRRLLARFQGECGA
jgi:hypothetical protein